MIEAFKIIKKYLPALVISSINVQLVEGSIILLRFRYSLYPPKTWEYK